MATRFAASTGCFYPYSQNYTVLPDDIFECSDADYVLAMCRSPRQLLTVVDGHVVVIDPPEPTLAESKLALNSTVDDHAEMARRSALVNTLRLAEYEVTAEQALAFKSADYLGTPPPAVQSWIEVTNQTPQVATDQILEMRRQYLDALLTIRDLRLHAKAEIDAAEDVVAAESIANQAIENIDAIGALVANI
jgi:hypothetical protein